MILMILLHAYLYYFSLTEFLSFVPKEYLLSVRVVGYIYDKQADKEDHSCFGINCFMPSFFILAAVAFLAFLVGLALFFRTRRFYKQVVLRRLKHYAR